MFDTLVQWPFHNLPQGVIAVALGLATGAVTFIGTRKSFLLCDLAPSRWPFWFALVGLGLGGAFVLAVEGVHCQQTPEVVPTETWRNLRMFYHLSLISLLLTATATDLKNYYILEITCWLGMGLGVGGAAISGDWQLIHIWVDWNQEIPQLKGPYLPAWLSAYPHLHGIAWSLAGAVLGAVVTAFVRWAAGFILAAHQMGSGDIYLMAMIGAYLGWQPTLIAFLIAPLYALAFAGIFRFATGSRPLPYGPFLALGAVTVLFTWRWIWMAEFSFSPNASGDRISTFAVRRFFGDPVALAIVSGAALGLLVLLTGLLRLYRMLPVRRTDG